MSVDTYVVCHQALPSVPAWQEAINRHQPPLVLDKSFNPEVDDGGWPATLGGRSSGFEFYRLTPAEVERTGRTVSFAPPWTAGAQFSIGASVLDMVAVAIAAVSLAQICDGVIVQDDIAYRHVDLDKYLAGVLHMAPLLTNLSAKLGLRP